MNIPYIKQYNDKGEVSNPINGRYENIYANRRQRKEQFNRGKNKCVDYKQVVVMAGPDVVVPNVNVWEWVNGEKQRPTWIKKTFTYKHIVHYK